MAMKFIKGISGTTVTYISRVRSFQPNARLFLINVLVTGAAMGIFRLLFNFYVLSLGYDEALLGRLVTASSLSALIFALPMGYLADILGRKNSLLLSVALMSVSLTCMVLWPNSGVFYITNIIFGISQSLGAVTMAPFLMENSGEQERTYLFSIGSGLQMTAASIGNWVGGFLPTWVAISRGVDATSSTAYGGALAVTAITSAFGILPLLFLRTPRSSRSERTIFAPLTYAAQHPRKLGRLILPMLLTSIGAGLIMPFMNVFYRQVYHQPDPVIGSLFAWGSLAMALGLLVAPSPGRADGQDPDGCNYTRDFHPLPGPARLFSLVLAQRSLLLRPAGIDEHERACLPDFCYGKRRTLRPRHRCQPGEHVLEFRLGLQPHDQRLVPG